MRRVFVGALLGSSLWLLGAVWLSVASAQLPPADASSDWQFIQKLRADGLQEAAARELLRFAQAHADDPRAPHALWLAGQEFEKLQQLPLALSAYERLLREHPLAPEVNAALLRKAELAAAAGRFDEAAEAYRSLLLGSADLAQREQAQLGLAETLMALGEAEDARRNLIFLLSEASSPSAARAYYDLGLLHLRAGEDSLAIDSFDLAAQRAPKESIAAFALLRAADRLAQLDELTGAQHRYERVLDTFDELPLRARAHLGLAALWTAQADMAAALQHYRAVAEGEGSKEQSAQAWLGVARCASELGEWEAVERAAQAYLATQTSPRDAAQARLWRAQAMRQRNRPAATDSLRALSTSPWREIAHAAWIELALAATARAEEESALAAWREAARTAPTADAAAEAMLAEAAQLAEQPDRAHAVSQLAEEAARRAESPELAARALWLAAKRAQEAGELARASGLATRLARDYPLSEPAPLAELLLRQLREAERYDVAAAADALAQLAARDDLSPFARALAIARIERDRWGEFERARTGFQRGYALASQDAERCEAAFELACTEESIALAAALDGDEARARQTLLEAMQHYAQAAALDAAPELVAAAELGSLRLEFATLAAPAAPWLFDARDTPLLGGVAIVESVDPSATSFDAMRARLDATLQAIPWEGDALAWLHWRQAELSPADVEARRQRLALAREAARDASLLQAIALCDALLRLERGSDERALQDLRALAQQAAGETALAARYLQAEQEREARQYASAEQSYLQFAGALPRTQKGERALLLAGDCAFFLAKPERAAEHYRALLARNEGSVYADDAVYRLATAQMRLGRQDSAQGLLQRLADWPGGSEYSGRALLRLAGMSRRRGDVKAASRQLQAVLERDAELAEREDVLFQLAETNLQDGRPADAQDWLKRREQERDRDAKGLALRVRAQAARRDWKAAQLSLAELDQNFAPARDDRAHAAIDLANALAVAGNLPEANSHLEAAAATADSTQLQARAEFRLGALALRANEVDGAFVHFDRASKLDREGAWGARALLQLGRLWERAQDGAKAQASYTELLDRHPQDPLAVDALRGQARVWKQLGRYDAASESYRRLIREHPRLPDAAELWAQIAYCQHEMGQFEPCITTYRRVMPELSSEERAYAQFWVADSYAQLGRHGEAAVEFLRIPFLYPNAGELPVTAELRAGEAYERSGDLESARQLYERVLKVHGPQSTWGAEARKRLDRRGERKVAGPTTSDGS